MKKNKVLYRIAILAGFVLLNLGILFGVSQVLAYLNTGADRAKMLHLDTTSARTYVPEVQWASLENPGRPIEAANLKKIEQDYLDAWQVKNRAFYTGDDAGIFDHFTKGARKKVTDLIAENTKNNTHVESTTLSHTMALEFYSADGTLAVLTDRNVSGVERIFNDNQLLLERKFLEDYKVILLLEDGFWRIRHFEKIGIQEPLTSHTWTAEDLGTIEGMNYYPKASPWDTFGNQFDSQILSTDFEILKDLKMNSIRIFVPYESFGGASVYPEKLAKLKTLLDEAQKADLKVMITLFDFYGNYRMQDWTLTNKHLNAIVSYVKEHPALLGWDLKNEPDLDFESRGKEEVLSWLQQSIWYLKRLDPEHPVTIGWSSPKAALHLEAHVDMVSYHYYKNLENLDGIHQKLRTATSKPVVLQEFGLSTYRGLWNPLGNTEEDQVAYYKAFYKTQKRDSLHYLSWTLYNFREIPNRVAGVLPWRKNKQAFFGIIDTLGVKDSTYLFIKNR